MLFLYTKMTNNCYQKHKEKLRKGARKRNPFSRRKRQKTKKAQERHQNFTKETQKKHNKNLFVE